MKTICLTLEYDGTHYCGWQRQSNGVTVQQRVEEAIEAFAGERLAVIGAGRTDSGVHAKGQVAHFKTDYPIPPERWFYALNTKLPGDIRVTASRLVPDGFHARYHALGKHYRYTFFNRDTSSALGRQFSWHIIGSVDYTAMARAAGLLQGTNDYSAFMAAGAQSRSPVRTIFKSALRRDGDFILYDCWGNGFLYNQVRIMAGTLYYVGLGKLGPEDITTLLAQGERAKAGPTAPPQGLCLRQVYYTEEELNNAWTHKNT